MALTVNNKPNTQTIGIAKGPTPMFPSYNPQTPAPIQIQPAIPIPRAAPTYNPQPASRTTPIQGSGSSNYVKVTAQQIIAEAARQADIARIAAMEQKKKLHDIKEAQIATKQKGFVNFLSRKVGLSGYTAARSKREKAVKFLNQNNDEAALYIAAKQRQFERDRAAKQQWLIDNQDNPEFSKLLDDANAWAESQQKSVSDLSNRYTKTQKELYQFAGSKVSGKASKILGTGYDAINKTVLHPVSKAWDAFTWTASQPARAVNTALNFVNPNRLRTYYGGKESSKGINVKSTPFSQLKSAYNASKNQRIIGYSKADEARRMRDFHFQAKDQNGKTITVHHSPDKFFGRYGDDIANLLADPINLLPGAWASKLGKASRLSKLSGPAFNLLGKTKFTRELAFRTALSDNSKIGKFVKYLGSAADSSKRDRFFADNRALLDRRKSITDEISANSADWKATKFAATRELNKRLAGISDTDAELLQRFMLNKNFGTSKFPDTVKASFSWDGVNVPRGFNKGKRQQIEDLARFIKNHTDTLHAKDIELALHSPKLLKQTYKAYKRGYLPQYKPRDFTGHSRPIPGTPYYLKQKTHQTLQKADELLQNLRHRTYGTLGQDSHSFAWLRNHMGDAKAQVSEMDRVLNTRAFGGDYKINRAEKIGQFNRKTKPYRPLSLWRKSVLLFRPAWYVNNALWNIPAAISAGGSKVIPELGKMVFSPKYRRSVSELTAPARSRISNEIGKGRLSRFASAVEDIPRSAAYKALLDKGKTPEAALNRTNDWLFNYSNKRIEQPIRSVLPFYNWSKGLTKLSLTMPFKYPRHAGFYSKLYQQFYQNPQSKLDNTTRTWTDEKGQTHTSNEQTKFKGKVLLYTDKSGKQHWSNTPFNALTPEQLGQINMNPLLVLGKMASESRDRFGNITTDRSLLKLGGEQFPQFSVFDKFRNRNQSSFERWFSKSGYSKESQGQDTTASNYNAGADNNSKFWKGLDSFLGKPSTVIRDPKAAAYNKRYTDFNTAYFSVDWDKRIQDLLATEPQTAYDKWNAEKDALAKKYGFDFKKDIVHGGWQKYDTYSSKRTKALKESAAAFMDSYWKEYAVLPKPQFIKTAKGGYWTPSTARPFWIDKFKQWRNQKTFADNPYLKLPYYNQKDAAGKNTGAKSYVNPYQLKQDEAASVARRSAGAAKFAASRRGSSYRFNGKFFKSRESMNRYIAFQTHHFSKTKSAKQLRFEFFQKYFAADTATRRKLIAENPQYNSFGDPSVIGFDAFRANKTNAGRLAARKLPGFSKLEASLLDDIQHRVFAHTPIGGRKKIAFKVR